MMNSVAEEGGGVRGDDIVGLPVSSVHSNRGSAARGSSQLSSARSTWSVESQPGAFTVQSHAAGNGPAWRQRLASQIGGFGGQSRRQQRSSRTRSARSRDDQSSVPPEMRQQHTSRFSQIFRSSRNASGSSNSRRSSIFAVRLFGGDAVVQPQEHASLPAHDDLDEGSFKKGLCAVLCVGILVIGVAVGVVLGVTGGDGNENPATPPGPPVEAGPPSIDGLETSRLVTIRDVLSYISGEDSTVLLEPTSPQYEALTWLAERDAAGIDETDVQRLEARYALATLFYATDGFRWTNRLEFLSERHECDWSPDPIQPFRRGVSCNGDMEVVSIFLGEYSVIGK
jgi:hypothetical protein